MATVKLAKVAKIYPGDVVAVEGVDLDIRDGEFLVLVGPSGCGKSTTLRMVAGLEDISRGEIRIGDRVVNQVPPKDRDIAMVFQNYALYPHMTVFENMAFGLKLRKFPKAEILRRVNDAARILGLEEYLNRRPKALSGGQRQRVAMGRAIVREPAVFLFDEPLSNLDAKMRVEMRKEILHLHRRIGATMIYVTHDQVEAMTLGDRICVMKDGRVQQLGEPWEVFDNPANLFVAGFIGTPPMNFFKGSLARDGEAFTFTGPHIAARLPAGMGSRLARLDGKPTTLGLRPKSLALKKRAPASWGDTVWRAEADIAEMLGEEIQAHMMLGGDRFIVSCGPHDHKLLGGTVEVVPDLNRAHVFDSESGENLTMSLDLPGRRGGRREA